MIAYSLNHRGPKSVRSNLRLGLMLALAGLALSVARSDAAASANVTTNTYGWKQFYAKYPKSSGFIELSRVAFDSSRTKALLYCGTTGDRGKGGVGYYILLRKQDGKWMIEKTVRAWVM